MLMPIAPFLDSVWPVCWCVVYMDWAAGVGKTDGNYQYLTMLYVFYPHNICHGVSRLGLGYVKW